MSDRGIGDHASKNIVKNPLLSTAVIGVSLEDLTHNAVLLPAVPSQELITRQDEQIGTQARPLVHLEQNTSSLSSGDANSNLSHPPQLPNVNLNPRDIQNNPYNSKHMESQNPTLSKASVKAEDDFDVNEYFARLQGTRYVSAPFNSAIKEEQNTEEENLEEINLNEPEKTDTDGFQQSITADIAQNFSQLPTVLPQVASAVFSSFSNMLSMKSREQTPDVGKSVPDYQNPQFQTEDFGVPLMSPDVVKEVAPPPKEPPIIGTASNYRITTRKKMYAQIPGLKSGDVTQNMPIYKPPMGIGNTPSHCTPDNNTSNVADVISFSEAATQATIIQDRIDSNVFGAPQSGIDKYFDENGQYNAPDNRLSNVSHNIPPAADVNQPLTYTPIEIKTKSVLTVEKKNQTDPLKWQSVETIQKMNQTDSSVSQKSNELLFTPITQPALSATASNVSVIPPPPMFSNLQKPQGQSNMRSVLPPSVARRISASNPVIKAQAPTSFLPQVHNIFVPTSDIQTESQEEQKNCKAASYVPTLMSNQSISTQESNKTSDLGAQSSLPYPMAGNFTSFTSVNPTLFQASNFSIPLSIENPQTLPTKNNKAELQTAIPYNISQPSDLSVKHLSQLNLEPPLSKLPLEFTSKSPTSEHTLFHMPLASQNKLPPTVTIPLPPVSFNPNTLSTLNLKSEENKEETGRSEDISTKTTFFEPDTAASEPITNLPEPPKISSNYNYRMTKKRPQYYSGPIEGFGSISNNVKPTIDPIQSNTFQGSLFTPQLSADSAPVDSGATLLGANHSSVPFDITHTTDNVLSYPNFEINKSQSQTNLQPEYNTAFDLSRQTTEYFDSSQGESKGFGIIGSLKSKLSSIDINKIQNTVTSFFDPAYNYTKMEATNNKENMPYDMVNQSEATYSDRFAKTQDNNLEIYVPTVELTSQSFVGNNYQMEENTNSDNINSGRNTGCYIPTQYLHNYIDNCTDTNLNRPFLGGTLNTSVQQPSHSISSWNTDLTYGSNHAHGVMRDVHSKNIDDSTLVDKEVPGANFASSSFPQISIFNPNTSHEIQDLTITHLKTQPPVASLFDNSYSLESKTYMGQITKTEGEEKEEKIKDLLMTQTSALCNIEDNIDPSNTDMIAKSTALENIEARDIIFPSTTIATEKDKSDSDFISETSKSEYISNLENNAFQGYEPPIGLSCVSLFSQPEADKSNNITDVTGERKNIDIFDTSKIPESNIFDHNAADFFDGVLPAENNLLMDNDQENDNDLNICETCREVTHKTEEKEVENLTDQLIENITAPIQLSNPVEVPFTESNMPNINISSFEPDQCNEISHITEETIDTIQVQAATELLDDIDNSTAIIKNYGWCTDDTNLTSSNLLLEHDFTLQPDGTKGFFQNKSLLFDNIPTNASDEIKAGYKNSFDDTLNVLPRQMSIPSAPPVEEDTKSDESGLDVLSIEQDAKKDFPVFEEYVIEPSETDDDKIEFREREKSSDDPLQDTDTFTNRVEKFKKMEETNVDHNDDVFEMNVNSKSFELPTTTSPSITIASYFDTGNYAVENHYRNSLTSPSNLNTIHSMPQTSIMRVPPGFEDEFQKKLSLVSNEGLVTSDREEFAKYAPDSTSQSNLSTTLATSQLSLDTSFSSNMPAQPTDKEPDSLQSGNLQSEAINVSEEILSPKGPQIKLPDFASVFGVDDKYEHTNTQETQSVVSKIQTEKILETPNQSVTENAAPLPDPTNFFSTDPDPIATENSEVYDFSRLSGYFSTPTQAEPSKSFFELSQSQNHYKQRTNSTSRNAKRIISDSSNNDNANAQLTQNQQNDDLNIPHEAYVANMNLIRDLTSPTNIDFIPKEQTVRSVNFFTVMYYDDSLNSSFTKGEPQYVESDITDRRDITNFDIELDELVETNVAVDRVTAVESCSYCCNMNTVRNREIDSKNLDNLSSSKVKFRNFNDHNDTDKNKEIDGMETKKEDDAGGRSVTVNFDNYSTNEDKEDSVAIVSENRSSGEYSPIKHHWFYRVDCEEKSTWKGFSFVDSAALENAFVSPDLNETTLVPTDGGRFDVNVIGRLRMPVYWSDKPTNVMRCSWFYKGTTDARYVPYPEAVAEKLEEEYKRGITTGEWHRRLLLPNSEMVVMHGPAVMVHFLQSGAADAFSSSPQSTMRPRVVRRGCDESEIEDSEPSKVDHLLLLCHGVGSACDMKFRPVEEVVDDFRATSLQLLQSHYKNSYESGVVGRIEVLPISWHSTLHSGETGVDKRLARITLDSIPRLRNFTNDTVLDVLFYTSPVFCQTIIDTVCKELNRIYSLFKTRNPTFDGGVSLGGHSLGSLILYDLLCHQKPLPSLEHHCLEKQCVDGTAGTGQPVVKYPRLQFQPDALYALGSPIAIFECIRGVELLGPGFCLPTCRNFFNIFHPYDPIAYRIEPLINPQLRDVKPFQIPHHKGRKRMHLELKDTMARVGADIKQKLIESIKNTWSSMWKTQPPPSDRQLEKVVEEEMEKEHLTDESKEDGGHDSEVTADMLGKLNDGRRVDFVLQEAPFEMINEYIFAMSSHVCYWESEDTMLLILREIYDGRGVSPDGSVPQHTMTLQRTRTVRSDDPHDVGIDCPSTSRGGI